MTIHIRLKLYASLSQFLPPGADHHSVSVELPDETTANQVIDKYNVPRAQAHLMLLNGVYLKPEDRDRPLFQDGDILAVWPPVAGG
jgi:molybdopterin converting factor small subunit